MGDNPNIGVPTYDQDGWHLIPQKAVNILRSLVTSEWTLSLSNSKYLLSTEGLKLAS